MIRRYLWQFLGALLALGAIFSTYDVFMRSRPVKELQVILNSASPLVRSKPLIPGHIQTSSSVQLTFNNNVISNAAIYQVTVKNTGNQPILESDYNQPLAFYFTPKDVILEIAVTASDPANIGMILNQTSTYQAEADPVLLNPGDTVSINFIVTTPDDTSLIDHFHVNGRIVGVKEIKLVPSPKPARASLDLKNISIFSMMGVLAGIFSSLVYERLLEVVRKSHLVEKGA
jgi:hypothetical protein